MDSGKEMGLKKSGSSNGDIEIEVIISSKENGIYFISDKDRENIGYSIVSDDKMIISSRKIVKSSI